MHLIRSLVATILLGGSLHASAVDDFKEAMASGDSTQKRQACQALASSSESDDVVLPLLVQAVGDRQTQDVAITALRARTHLTPAPYLGQSHYPNYPSGDTPADWSTWLGERQKEKDQEKKLAEAEKTAAEAKKKAEAAEKAEKDRKTKKDTGDKPADTADAGDKGDKAADTGGATTAKTPPREPQPLPADVGKLDRVVFKNGSNLLCYILTRRTDADGNLLSVRVIHPDGSGEETLAASMISRIEEDVSQ